MSIGRKIIRPVKRKGIALGIGVMLLATGCLKTPEIEYVTNKENQGNYTYEENSNGSGNIAEQVGAPAHVEQEGKTLNKYTFITIDADVLISAESKVPVYAISPLSITEDMIEFYAGKLYEGEIYRYPYYEPLYELPPVTQESIYSRIGEYQNILDSCVLVENPVYDEKGFILDESGNIWHEAIDQEEYDALQSQIVALQQELLTAPEEKDLIREATYEWESHKIQLKDFSSDGSEVYTDYDYEATAFVGQRQGKRFYLTVTKDGNHTLLSFSLDREEKLDNDYRYGDLIFQPAIAYTEGSNIDNQCQYTAEEAANLCQEFLEELELRDMDVQMIKHLKASDGDDSIGYQGYQIYCYRTYDGTGDSFYSASQIDHGGIVNRGDDYISFDLPDMYEYHQETGIIEEREGSHREIAIFTVLSEGIVQVNILNPMKNQELLAENAKLVDFNTILNQGISQMSILYGDFGSESASWNMQVNTIELNYACMESPDGNQEYTMIPVWDFKSGRSGATYISINAVDGTVFDRGLGH